MPPSYRIEICPNNRAVCKNTECKNEAVKIVKGELRFGNLVEINEHQSWAYKHWGCVTPYQISNWWNNVAGKDIDLVDGYDELPPDAQKKIKRCLEQGHVDDEDWKGDVEMNRGQNKKMRMPASTKKKLAKEADEFVEPESPTVPKKKKRSRLEDENGDDMDIPANKPKAKGKSAKVKAEENEAVEASNPPPKKKAKTTKSDMAIEEPARPVTKSKSKASKTKVAGDSAAPKKSTKAVKTEDPVTNPEPVAAKKTSKPKKAKVEEPDPIVKPTTTANKKSSKTATAKKEKSESTGKPAAVKSRGKANPAAEEVAEQPVKKGKGRPKKAT